MFCSSITKSLFSSNGVNPLKNQNYEDLKRQAQESQTLFEDPEFPPNESSLFYKGNVAQLPGQVVWKRPKVCIIFLWIKLLFTICLLLARVVMGWQTGQLPRAAGFSGGKFLETIQEAVWSKNLNLPSSWEYLLMHTNLYIIYKSRSPEIAMYSEFFFKSFFLISNFEFFEFQFWGWILIKGRQDINDVEWMVGRLCTSSSFFLFSKV